MSAKKFQFKVRTLKVHLCLTHKANFRGFLYHLKNLFSSKVMSPLLGTFSDKEIIQINKHDLNDDEEEEIDIPIELFKKTKSRFKYKLNYAFFTALKFFCFYLMLLLIE